MPLERGTRLGPYQIESPIGAGGMGEVYKATDTRLERTVAIKVLPAHVASDPERKSRFEREAKTISSLNHPHICTLYEFGTGRDWARLGNLYLQDGMWNGERILPEGWVEYATTLAPAWVADGRPVYGGAFLWVNGNEGWPLPETAYGFRGAGGQSTTVIPTHDLVVVRLGKYRGAGAGGRALNRAFEMLVEAVPPARP